MLIAVGALLYYYRGSGVKVEEEDAPKNTAPEEDAPAPPDAEGSERPLDPRPEDTRFGLKPKGICVGMNKQGESSCYGDDKGCLWDGPLCKKDPDCSKYSIDSAHFTNTHTCDSMKGNEDVPADYWGRFACT